MSGTLGEDQGSFRLVGWTGGVGMGKSTSGKILEGLGVPVIDTDKLALDLVQPGQVALAEIADRFGPAMLRADGQLDRARLAELVFADPGQRAVLEGILHPKIRSAWVAQAARWREDGCSLGVVLIPLLFETAVESLFDWTVCVACGAETQWSRLRARGWDSVQIQGRLAAQWPVARKMEAARFVVWTEGCLEAHEQQIELILGLG